tara:strand:+ start:778 stop:1323 length:546 start_codon:yes stop_codon:yes gene_type:complete
MGIFSNLFISSSVSMDTLILGYQESNYPRKIIINAVFVSIIQTVFFSSGFLIGNHAYGLLKDYDHWIILILLTYFGLNSIFEKAESQSENKSLPVLKFFLISIAVSADALAVGFSISNSIDLTVSLVALVFIITAGSFFIGNKLKNLKSIFDFRAAKIISGIVLIMIGLKVFLSHMFDHGF